MPICIGCAECKIPIKKKAIETFSEPRYAIVVVQSLLYNGEHYKKNDKILISSLQGLENFVQII